MYDQEKKFSDGIHGITALDGYHQYLKCIGDWQSIAPSPDRARVFMGNKDGRVRAWDVGSKQFLVEWVAHVGNVKALVASQEGSHLYSVGKNCESIFLTIENMYS